MTDPGDDQGLAAERTSLARERTSLALLACGAAVLKGLPLETGRAARPAAGAAIVALAAAVWLQGVWAARARRAAAARGQAAAGRSPARAVALSTALIGVVAFVVAALG